MLLVERHLTTAGPLIPLNPSTPSAPFLAKCDYAPFGHRPDCNRRTGPRGAGIAARDESSPARGQARSDFRRPLAEARENQRGGGKGGIVEWHLETISNRYAALRV